MKLLKINHNGIEILSLELVDGTEHIAGRDESCQIRLQDAAISRRHFRIFQDGGEWKIENISKFGKLLQGGAPITIGTMGPLSAFAVPPYQIALIEKVEERKIEAPLASEGFAHQDNGAMVPTSHFGEDAEVREEELQNSIQRIASQAPVSESTDEAIDKTWVASMGSPSNPEQGLHIAGYLTISEAGQEDALWKLDRNPEGEDQWIIGRDASCQVQVVGVGVSRKHFEIRQRHGEFFIADLKSSKGTLLNGVKLRPRTEVPFRSGDSVEFANSMARFELRDENFEKGLSNLPVPFEPMGTSIQTMDMQVFQSQNQNQELLVNEAPAGS
ncbi:MAG: FHA domain-containing protein, partial [Bdellovibrionales bacterium]|nr:FHA domain-containing protein [Bdellovibrionales bacterium]